MSCSLPTVNSPVAAERELFDSVRTIAVAGLSPDPSKDSHRVAAYLQNAGYRIIPVYPKEVTILGESAYRSIGDIPDAVDMVVVFRKPDAVDAIVDEIVERGDVKVLWLQIGIVNDAAAGRAADAGMTVVQNRCAMVRHRMLGEVR